MTVGGRWLRVHGLAQARAALAAWPAHAGPLPLIGPRGAVETLGPGWPRAVRDALIGPGHGEARSDAERTVVLAVECGAAVGFALAVLDDWEDEDAEKARLVLVLAYSVPEAARAAVSARAAARGVRVVDTGSPRSLDVGPDASPADVARQARALAATRGT